jgi:hypothetical protein
MGLDSAIREACRTFLAPEAWHPAFAPVKGAVCLHDFLTSLVGATITSGNELFEKIWTPVKLALSGPVDIYVIILDDGANVRRSGKKARVQKARLEARKKAAESKNAKIMASLESTEVDGEYVLKFTEEKLVCIDPYEPETQITDFGMLRPGDDEKEEPFEFARMMASQTLRHTMWDYICKRLTRMKLAQGKCVIFDYECEGPAMMFHSPEVNDPISSRFLHNHGEFDTTMQYYLWLFSDRAIRIVSSDTDVIALILAYIEAEPYGMKVKDLIEWGYYHSSSKASESEHRVVNMRQLHALAPTRCGLNANQFVMACILSGTDMYDKMTMSRGFAWRHVFAAVRLSRLGLFGVDSEPSGDIEGMKLYQRWLFTASIHETPKRKRDEGPWNRQDPAVMLFTSIPKEPLSEEKIRECKKGITKMRPWASDSDLRLAEAEFFCNVNYWCEEYKEFTQEETLREMLYERITRE